MNISKTNHVPKPKLVLSRETLRQLSLSSTSDPEGTKLGSDVQTCCAVCTTTDPSCKPPYRGPDSTGPDCTKQACRPK